MLVVFGGIRVKPVAFPVHIEDKLFAHGGGFDKPLALGNERLNQFHLAGVEMEFVGVEPEIGVRIGQENLGRKRIEQRKQVRFLQVFGRLRCHNENAVMLAPSFRGLNEIVANNGYGKKLPCLIQNENLERRADSRVIDDGAGAVQYIKEQSLDQLRIFIHALKVEALQRR